MPRSRKPVSRLRKHAAASWVAIIWAFTAWLLGYRENPDSAGSLHILLLPLFLIPALLACELVLAPLWQPRNSPGMRLLRAVGGAAIAGLVYLLALDGQLSLLLGAEFSELLVNAGADAYPEYFASERIPMLLWLVPLGSLALFFSMLHVEVREGIP